VSAEQTRKAKYAVSYMKISDQGERLNEMITSE